MVGFTLWFLGQTHVLMVSLGVNSMVSLMNDMGLRYRAWHQNTAELGNFVALIFYTLGSILFIAQQPVGSFLVAGLLWLFASVVQVGVRAGCSEAWTTRTRTHPHQPPLPCLGHSSCRIGWP